MLRFLPFAASLVLVGCTTSGTITPTDAGTDSPVQPITQSCSADAGGLFIYSTSACTGDLTRCLSGTLALKGFTAQAAGSKVELYKVFPNGTATCALTTAVARDGTFAFSALDAWDHYYLKGIARFGASATPVAVAAVQGRYAVPGDTGAPITLTVIPAKLELLETTNKGSPRGLQWISAHVYDPSTGGELTDAVVTASGTNLAQTPMPYATNVSGQKSYFVMFTTPPSSVANIQIQATHAALGSTGATFSLAPEASRFDEPALASPPANGTIGVNQPLDVTWPALPLADFTVVTLFARQGTSFTSVYASATPNTPDVVKETIPASSIAAAGQYLLNVNFAQSRCGKSSDGCSTVLHASAASLTAQ